MLIADSIQIIGDRELARKLTMLGDKSLSRVMKPAINKGLNPIMKQAKNNCRWNSLRKLIGKRAFVTKKKKVAGKVYLKPSPDRTIKLEGRDVGFEVVANILEFGRKSGDLKPMPFMRPARDQAKGAAYRATEDEARKQLKKLVESGKVVNL